MGALSLVKGTIIVSIVVLAVRIGQASTDTIGPNGINSAGLGLDGAGIDIGQVEPERSGDPSFDTNGDLFHSSVNPAQVFVRNPGPPLDFEAEENEVININQRAHAVGIAGVMVSTDISDPDMDGDSPTGVATGAALYSAAYNHPGLDVQEEAAITLQHLAAIPTADIRAINMSFGSELGSDILDGHSLFTLFVDWSAATHDVLYVVAGNENLGGIPLPTDNFNGLTVATSAKMDGVYRQVATRNYYAEGFFGPPNNPAFRRTFTDLLAPGEEVKLASLGDMTITRDGTSIAAPHVTGTVALLQQYAEERIMNAGGPRWNANARRHEVMKAVLLNSADKIEDTGDGNLLGMERTVVDTDGVSTWLDSDAFSEEAVPLDLRMGAGHLNAKRALQQFQSGEYSSDAAPVPVIGWDYGQTTGDEDIRKYALTQPLRAGSYISITLAWDREVLFDTDGGTAGEYDIGDTFQQDCCVTDLALYLVLAGETDFEAYEAASLSFVMTVEHIFAPIAMEGMYEIWVRQFSSFFGGPQDYALAWWGVSANPTPPGDYSGNGTVGPEDYDVWTASFGTTDSAADGNEDGIVDAADYVIWRKNLSSGSAGFAQVPEPQSIFLILSALVFFAARIRRWVPLLARPAVQFR